MKMAITNYSSYVSNCTAENAMLGEVAQHRPELVPAACTVAEGMCLETADHSGKADYHVLRVT